MKFPRINPIFITALLALSIIPLADGADPPWVDLKVKLSDTMLKVPPEQYVDGRGYDPKTFSKYTVTIELTNQSDKPMRFANWNNSSPVLKNADGRILDFIPYSNAHPNPKLSSYPLVEPGKSVTFTKELWIVWDDDGLCLSFSDDGLIFDYRGIPRGKYLFAVQYRVSRQQIRPGSRGGDVLGTHASEVWLGSGTSKFIEIEIR
jgi:hypothetical protein